jgi:hypothetical protein
MYRPCGGLFAVDGTAYPGAPGAELPITNDGTGWWSGLASGMVGGLENMQDGLWNSWMVSYEASVCPMWPSVQQGRGYLITAIQQFEVWCMQQFGTYLPIIMAGYSQGTMVTDQVWVYDILSPTGVLHYLLPFVYRIYEFGHIFRSPGIAYANQLAGLPQSIKADGQETGGIGCVLDLTVAQTNYAAPDGKPVITSAANKGDIYGCCPTGLNPWTNLSKQGKTGQLFFKVIMQPTFAECAEVLAMPVDAIEEGIAAGTFFAEGMASPHYTYGVQMDACINDALVLGNSLPHQAGL